MKRIMMFILTASLLVPVARMSVAAGHSAQQSPPAAPAQALDPAGDDLGPVADMPPPPGDAMGAGHGGGPDDWGGMHGHGTGMRGMGPERLLEQLTGSLALTTEQRDKLAQIRDAHERDDIRARADLEIARLDLRKLLRAEPPDRTAIEAQIDRIAQMEARLHKSRVGMMLDGRAVLTPAQLKKLRELRETNAPPRGPGRGPGREGSM